MIYSFILLGQPAFATDSLRLLAERIAFAGPLLAEEPFTVACFYASSQVYAYNNRWPQKVGFPPAP